MSKVKKIKFDDLSKFHKDNSSLTIVERELPKEANSFFKQLLIKPLNVKKNICTRSSVMDINLLLEEVLSINIKKNIFYSFWIKDMANIIQTFSSIIRRLNINLSLETSRSCKRYHIDNVPMRLLVTYYGKGTEWFPCHACDYSAYYSGKKNEEIIKNINEQKFINTWDIAIFRGQKFKGIEKGILHRTPEAALNSKSLLMRLDYPD